MSQSNPPYEGAKKYVVPFQVNADGTKRMLLPALGNIVMHPSEQALMIYAPGMPYATLYTYADLKEIVGWLQEEQQEVDDSKQKVEFEEPSEPLEVPDEASESPLFEGASFEDSKRIAQAEQKLSNILSEKYGPHNENLLGVNTVLEQDGFVLQVACVQSWQYRLLQDLPFNIDGMPVFVCVSHSPRKRVR